MKHPELFWEEDKITKLCINSICKVLYTAMMPLYSSVGQIPHMQLFYAIFVTGNLGHPCLFPTFGSGGSKAGASSLALRRMSVITQSRKRETSVSLIG